MDSRNKTHPSQWSALLDFAEENPIILTKRFEGLRGRQSYIKLWNQLTNTLNSLGYAQKSVDKWQKAVADWKAKVKRKAQNIRKSINQTGGGSSLPPLTENEVRLMSLSGWSCVHGNNNKELGKSMELTQKENYNPLDLHSHAAVSNDAIAGTSTNEKCSSPPPLVYLQPNNNQGSENEIFTMEKDISDNLLITSNITDKEKENKNKRKSIPPASVKNFCKRQFTPYNIQQMQNDTLQVLNEINKNIDRVAESIETLCDIHAQLLEYFTSRHE